MFVGYIKESNQLGLKFQQEILFQENKPVSRVGEE